MTTLKREFTALWLAWAAFLFGAELLFPGSLHWTRPVGLAWFVLLEGAGLVRAGPGDLLSEHAWVFYGGRPARIPLVLGMVAYVAIAIWEVSTDLVLMVGPIPAARFALGAGVAGWLLPHLLGQGRWG